MFFDNPRRITYSAASAVYIGRWLYSYQKSYKELKIGDKQLQQMMQKRFASVMTTYHKRNGASTYNQS